MFKFTYSEPSDEGGGKIIFECIANGILDADKMYQDKIGVDPSKQNYIGCSAVWFEEKEC
jgi:hypothetical protein